MYVPTYIHVYRRQSYANTSKQRQNSRKRDRIAKLCATLIKKVKADFKRQSHFQSFTCTYVPTTFKRKPYINKTVHAPISAKRGKQKTKLSQQKMPMTKSSPTTWGNNTTTLSLSLSLSFSLDLLSFLKFVCMYEKEKDVPNTLPWTNFLRMSAYRRNQGKNGWCTTKEWQPLGHC
jgi:hypothetical protein